MPRLQSPFWRALVPEVCYNCNYEPVMFLQLVTILGVYQDMTKMSWGQVNENVCISVPTKLLTLNPHSFPRSRVYHDGPAGHPHINKCSGGVCMPRCPTVWQCVDLPVPGLFASKRWTPDVTSYGLSAQTLQNGFYENLLPLVAVSAGEGWGTQAQAHRTGSSQAGRRHPHLNVWLVFASGKYSYPF